MSNTMQQLMAERMRLVQVRLGLSAAVEQGANGDELFIPFYVAVTDYFQHAMDRLDRQDHAMLSMLEEKTLAANVDPGTAISDVYERLDNNSKLLKEMTQASQNLNQGSLAQFEEIATRYCRYIVEHMGHHAPSANLALQLFSEDDWVAMADFNEQATEDEQQLFNFVISTAPSSIRDVVETVPKMGGPPPTN